PPRHLERQLLDPRARLRERGLGFLEIRLAELHLLLEPRHHLVERGLAGARRLVAIALRPRRRPLEPGDVLAGGLELLGHARELLVAIAQIGVRLLQLALALLEIAARLHELLLALVRVLGRFVERALLRRRLLRSLLELALRGRECLLGP